MAEEMTDQPAGAPSPAAEDEQARDMVKAVVCYSGGVDSTLLASLVLDQVDPVDVRVLLASSFLMDSEERAFARRQAADLGFPLVEIEHPGACLDAVLTNQPQRCYACKKALFSRVRELYPHALIYCGENLDDASEDRPGQRAITEFDVRCPLRDAGLTKDDIRAASREAGLPAADRPSNSCYATRFPEGATITPELVHRAALIENAQRATHKDARKVRARCLDVDQRIFDVKITS